MQVSRLAGSVSSSRVEYKPGSRPAWSGWDQHSSTKPAWPACWLKTRMGDNGKTTELVHMHYNWSLSAHASQAFNMYTSARDWQGVGSAWVSPVCAQVQACSRETHSHCRASKTYGHNAFQIIHIHTTVINSGRAHTTQHRTHCGAALGS